MPGWLPGVAIPGYPLPRFRRLPRRSTSEAVDKVVAMHSEGWRHEMTEKRWRPLSTPTPRRC